MKHFELSMKQVKKCLALTLAAVTVTGAVLTGCGTKAEEVVIYTNADDEAIEAMRKHWMPMAMKVSIWYSPLALPSLEASCWQKVPILKRIW